MNNTFSNSTISTSASLNRGISSKNILLGFGSRNALFKANRNAKFNFAGAGGNSRWRAPERRDVSLNNLKAPKTKSSMTNLLNRLQASRVVSNQNLGNATFENKPTARRRTDDSNNAQFSEAPISEICFVKDQIVPAISIKSAALNRALHRDIMLKDNKQTARGEGRWSSRNVGEKSGSALNQPRRQVSAAVLKQPSRKVSNYDLNR